MVIKPLEEHRQFDVFLGNGWDNWVRVRYTRGGVEVVKSSFQPSAETLELVFYKLKKKFFTQPKKSGSTSPGQKETT